MHTRLGFFSFLWLMMVMAFGCKTSVEPVEVKRFEVTDSLVKRLLVDTVQQANAVQELNFSARIAADEEREALVYPMVSGTVNNVAVKIGDRVKKGQLLATLASAEMAGFEKEVASSSAELRNAGRSLEEAEQLYKSGLASARNLEEAKNEFLVKQAEDKRARSILKLNGGDANGKYTILSPISGFIVERNVNTNMQLRADNDQNLFSIADLSVVSAMVNIYESDISRIREGDEVKVSILSYPDRSFSGIINKIYNTLDKDSKVMHAKVSISNPELLLKPGMLATVKIRSKSGINLPGVTSRGIIFDEDRNFVLKLSASNQVKIQEVEISRKAADKVYISKGLDAGDRIIASKQVFIYESLKN
jgi:cobalt-zinc-cadmium efflux system membrane fusion protein